MEILCGISGKIFLKRKECVPILSSVPSHCLKCRCGDWCSKIHIVSRGQEPYLKHNRAENWKDLSPLITVEPPYQPWALSWLLLYKRERSICLVYDYSLEFLLLSPELCPHQFGEQYGFAEIFFFMIDGGEGNISLYTVNNIFIMQVLCLVSSQIQIPFSAPSPYQARPIHPTNSLWYFFLLLESGPTLIPKWHLGGHSTYFTPSSGILFPI